METKPNNKKSQQRKWLPTLKTAAFTVIIFGLGFGLGSGRLQIGGLQSTQKDLPANLDMATVEQVYDSLKQNYDGQLDINKLMDGLKHGLTQAAGDPYTGYFSPKEADEFQDQLNGTFQGIGAELGKDKDNNLIVVSPIAGFPAEKAGIRPKDIIAAVNGESTVNMSVDQAVGKIRGPKGTEVKLKIVRGGEQLDVKITRAEIKIPSVTHKTLDGNIGYIKVNQFSTDTVALATKAANSFKQAGVKGVVLDLRGNPGGDLSASVGLSSLWLKQGDVVLTERRDNKVIETFKASGNPILQGVKTVVLINEGSASASEITAGALKDNKAARLIGVKSFGKGSVQQLVNFGDGSLLKVTIARWYTPGGQNIDKQGIEPDQKVDRSEADIKADKDPQLDAATIYIKK